MNNKWIDLNEQIGSDEVGTGDVFGGEVVVAAYYNSKYSNLLNELNIDDSKKISDSTILKIGAILKEKVPYFSILIDAKKYNKMISEGYNANSIKAMLHNYAHNKLLEKLKRNDITIFVDDFCGEKNYYKYIYPNECPKKIIFETKGETKFPSVAIASIIARYNFLIEWEKIEEKLQIKIPKGASNLVDEVLDLLYKQLGLNGLKDFVKQNFKNYKIIKEKDNEKL